MSADPGALDVVRSLGPVSPWRRDINPIDFDTTALDRVLARSDMTKEATAVLFVCPRNHTLARVVQSGGQYIYVARRFWPSLGTVITGANPTILPPTAEDTHQGAQYIYLLTKESLAPTFGLPAECRCLQPQIPLPLIARKLGEWSAGGRAQCCNVVINR